MRNLILVCGAILYSSNALGQNASGVSIPFSGGGLNGSLSITAEQGFSRGLVSNGTMVTVPNAVPGFVFGGTVSPFVTGVFPVLSAGAPAYPPEGVSPIQRMFMRGDIRLQRDESGSVRLVVSEPARGNVAPEPRKANGSSGTKADSSDSFRRGLEKYARPKR